jgi:hypothetical protein
MRHAVPRFRYSLIVVLLAAGGFAQGPGSCGFHLDLVTNDTSTHSAIADVPGAPGSAPGGLRPGGPGNPYCGYATPGTQVRVRLEIPPDNLANFAGTTPYGAGGTVSIFFAAGAPGIPIAPLPGAIPPCSAATWTVSVLPLGGFLVDGLGVMSPPPVIVPSDPGFPGAFEITVTYPPGLPPITMQAVVLLPAGQLAVSNGVALIAGPNPHEIPLAFAPPTGCIWTATDEGTAPVPMPSGFRFYDVVTTSGVVRPNGLVEFGPAAGTGCPYDQGSNDFGCVPSVPSVTPRVSANLVDNDLGLVPLGANVTAATVEYAPPGAGAPSRTIVRWKHASPWYTVPGSALYTDHASTACEFWGEDVPAGSQAAGSSIVVVRQEIHVGLQLSVHGALGIGPGYAGQGFGGPPANCHWIDLWTTWGGWYFVGLPTEALLLNFLPAGSMQLAHLATTFTPIGGGAYRAEAY